MADHTVTIKTGCALDPQTCGGSPNPIFTGDVVNFVNQAGVPCILSFSPPSPFGNPTINVAFPGTESRRITGVVHSQTDFRYRCTASTGALSPAAASATAPLAPTDPGDGIIIVDPPGGGGPAATTTTAPKTTTTRSQQRNPNAKPRAKPRRVRCGQRPNRRARANPEAKARPRVRPKPKPKKSTEWLGPLTNIGERGRWLSGPALSIS